MAEKKPVAAHDLPASAFPFTIKFFRLEDDTEITEHRIEVTEGPVMVEIPGLYDEYGLTWCRIEYADGQAHESPTKEEREGWKNSIDLSQ